MTESLFQDAPAPCTAECWTAVPCPSCGAPLPPRGRSVPMAMTLSSCCEESRYDDANKRHLWDANDDERWRFHPEQGEVMSEAAQNAAQTAVDVLTSIAEDTDAKPSDETRIRAACAILDRLDKVPEGSPVAA